MMEMPTLGLNKYLKNHLLLHPWTPKERHIVVNHLAIPEIAIETKSAIVKEMVEVS